MIRTTPPTIISNDSRQNLDRTDVRQSRIENHEKPDSFEEMFDRFYGYVVRLVKANGIHHNQAEDVAMTILTRFYERKSLDFYSEDFSVTHGGKAQTVRFTSFLSGFVMKYLLHHQVMQTKRAQREVASTTELFGDDPDQDPQWLENHHLVAAEQHESLEYHDTVQTIRDRLQWTFPLVPQDHCDLPAFFEAIREQVNDLGCVDNKALAEKFQVSRQTILNWRARLRTELADVELR